MGILVNWENKEKTIIRYVFDGRWNWDRFESVFEQGVAMTEEVSHPVDAIWDFTSSAELPDDFVIMWKQVMSVLPANHGKSAFVSNNKKIDTPIKMFFNINKAFRDSIALANSVDHAHTLLGHHIPSLCTILVIDDEAPLREEIVEILQFEGYNTLAADNGLDGVKKAKEKMPNIIVCDVSMPQMDGYGVIQELRREKATAAIPFIFLTARADRSFMRHGMELGADDYLTKPFTSNELISAITMRLQRQAVIKNSTAS